MEFLAYLFGFAMGLTGASLGFLFIRAERNVNRQLGSEHFFGKGSPRKRDETISFMASGVEKDLLDDLKEIHEFDDRSDLIREALLHWWVDHPRVGRTR